MILLKIVLTISHIRHESAEVHACAADWFLKVENYPRPQRPRSIWSTSRIPTSGLVQHADYLSLCACTESSLANLIGWEYQTNSLHNLRKSGPARGFTAVKRLGTRAIYALPVTSGHFPVSSYKISKVNLLHSSHIELGTKSNHSASTNVLLPSFTA